MAMLARPSLANKPVDTVTPDPASVTLAGWFRTPTPSYVPLNKVSFGALELTTPTPVPQYPDATGIRGGVIESFNKLAEYGPVQRILGASRVMTRF